MKRRRLCIAVAASLVAPMMLVVAGPAGAQPAFSAQPLVPTSRMVADKSPTSRLAESDQALLDRTDAALTPMLVKLDYDSVATYGGGVENLAATSPAVTGQPLRGGPAEQRYEQYAARQEADFTAELRRRIPAAEVGSSLRTVYGGIAITVPANRAEDVLAIDNVVAVHENAMRKPLTDSSPKFLGAPALYDALGSVPNAGQGTILGNLDSGVWPEHPSFADQGNLPAPPGPARECNFGDNPLTPETDVFACQNKLIGGAHFTDDYDEFFGDDEFAGTARDSDGHGTHTASTSAGNVVDDVSILGSALPPIHGLAPGAYVMEYKVCGPQGCLSSDSMAAVGQAIRDGVDVINFSISGGVQPFNDPVELAFLDAYAAGVFVSTSAGNEGPTAGTANHVSPWVTSVAASTQTREFAATLTVTAGGDTFTSSGASIMPGAGPFPIVLSSDAPYSSPLCDVPAPAGTFTGKIVACERGGNARVEKGFNVLQGGAEGMVLYNPTLADTETDTHWLPAVHLADGTEFLAFLTAHPGAIAEFTQGRPSDTGKGDVMAAFSSRGPAGNVIKPDLTAPGVQILAGDTPISAGPVSGPAGQLYQAIAGTSMSSPHVAGAALLLTALHPDWTPGQIRSALMTTATTAVLKEDAQTPADPFDRGAGRIDLSAAGNPGLTFDETMENMALLGNDPVNAVHLNIPSINAPVLPGRLTTVRKAVNVSGERLRYEAQGIAPPGSTITIEPREIDIEPGDSVALKITITSLEQTGEQQFGEVRLVPQRGTTVPLHLPVAFVPQQGSVSLMSDCAPDAIGQGEHSRCTVVAQNNGVTDTTATVSTTVSSELGVVGAVGASRTPGGVGVAETPLRGSSPGVPAVAPGASPAGYLPLDDLDIPATPIGDEEILNFQTPPFVYAGVTYDSLGVDSNGYVVAGPATPEDNQCCLLTGAPDKARPNNVLAPFWTDLDGTGAPGILAGEVTDGVNSWVVVEFRVNVFATTDQRTFQVWIGVNGSEDVSFTYAAPQADPAGQPFQVGAENVAGQGDIEAVLPTADLRVTSTDPTPGDTVRYTLDLVGVHSGTGTVTTSLTSPAVAGTTVVTSEVVVR